jgi:DNA-binding transcriptional LysR family regulator
MSDRLAALELFVAIAAHGALAPAARELGLGPARASRLLASLEARLGVQLARRTTRALSLTDAGRRYLGPASRAMAELTAADAALKGSDSAPAGTLRISAPTQFGALHVAPLAAELIAAHPALSVDLQLDDRAVDPIAGGFDATLRIGVPPPGSLIARRVGETRVATVAAPAYLELHGTPATPDDLDDRECLLWRGSGRTVAWRFRRNGRLREREIHGRFMADSPAAVLNAAIAGAGLARLPEYQARSALADGRLVEVLADFAPPPVPISVLYAAPGPGLQLPAKLRVFIDLAVARLAPPKSRAGQRRAGSLA